MKILNIELPKNISILYINIKTIIDTSKQEDTIQFNNIMVLSYWELGKQLKLEILKDERATYGEEVVQTTSTRR